MTRIYGFEITDYPREQFKTESDVDGNFSWDSGFKPAGWDDHVKEMGWQPDTPFFWPSEKKIFNSRSAAQSRVDIVHRWGGKAVLLEGQVSWSTVEAANQRRADQRKLDSVQKLQAEADRLWSELEASKAVA